MANNNENIPYGNTGGDFVLSDTEEKKMKVAMGNRIKQAMENMNMTQAELAAKVLPLGGDGKPQQTTISKWINGSRSPDTMKWCTLAHVLNVSLDWLLLGKEKEDTIQDVARSLSKLATVTDMHIERCTQDDPEVNEDERNYNGIQITLFPRRKLFYINESRSSATSFSRESINSVPIDRLIAIEDNRGNILIDFLWHFIRNLDEYRNNIYSKFDHDINSRVELPVSSLPALSIAPIPDNLNKKELYNRSGSSVELNKIPWFISARGYNV